MAIEARTPSLAGRRPTPLQSVRCFLVDLDGVVYRGNAPIPGAAAFFRLLEGRGVDYRLITNNSRQTPEQYVAKLRGMGVQMDEQHVFTSGQATAAYLAGVAGSGARVLALGEEGLVRPLLDAGFRLDDYRPDFVVVGLDTRLTYERLKLACLALSRGAAFVASNADRALPTEDGLWPGNGAILAALEAATDREPLIVGKPSPRMLQLAMQHAGAAAAQTAIVGDGLATDIAAGHEAELTTVLVLSGVTTRAQAVAAGIKPDYVFEGLHELASALSSA